MQICCVLVITTVNSSQILFFVIYYVSEAPEAKDKNKKKEEPSSVFQRQRVDLLLGELSKKFPPKFIQPTQPEPKGTLYSMYPFLIVKFTIGV